MLPTKDELLEYYYLGVPAIREQAVWRTIGRENKLVTADSVRAADRKAARIAEIEEVKVSERFGNRGTSQRTSIPETLVPADLTFVAVISPDNFWLMPDVNWRGETLYTKTFENVKLGCCLVAPNTPDFAASDFSEALANLDWFMGASATPGNMRQSIVDAATIKIRHVLFEVSTYFVIHLCSLLTSKHRESRASLSVSVQYSSTSPNLLMGIGLRRFRGQSYGRLALQYGRGSEGARHNKEDSPSTSA
jgi:hypothetical protein